MAARSPFASDCTRAQEWAKPQAGDVFVWVGQLGQIEVPWQSLQARGVFTVYYQTEPREGCDLHGPDGIDEVWDYSWHNIEVGVKRSMGGARAPER